MSIKLDGTAIAKRPKAKRKAAKKGAKKVAETPTQSR